MVEVAEVQRSLLLQATDWMPEPVASFAFAAGLIITDQFLRWLP